MSTSEDEIATLNNNDITINNSNNWKKKLITWKPISKQKRHIMKSSLQ